MLIIGGKEVFSTLEELVQPEHTALLLIDFENDFISEGGCYDEMGFDLSAARQIVPRVKRVLEAARQKGVLVIYTQNTLYSDQRGESPAYLRMALLRTGYFDEGKASFERNPPHCIKGSWGREIIDELAPLPNEIIIEKNRNSAFMGTNLDMFLRCSNIKTVVIAGMATQGCVMITANDVPNLGYYPVVLRDCVAGRSQKYHDAALLLMSSKMDVIGSEEVLRVWMK
jgi:nicotinamidase-related amidase